MFYCRRKSHGLYGYLFVILSIIAAFILGRKCEQCGYSIVTRECWGLNGKNKKRAEEWDEELDPPGDPVGA